ncbi:type III-B CRISPR module-associated protein Cmr5 [Treponema vincentii]|uniref:type III-B CRISPR module-associated protein Cmr5 n=1 Tax=Treponema vincentii TaxID=69710 RepID=UPI0035F5C6CF
MQNTQTIQQQRAAFALDQLSNLNHGKIDKELAQFIIGVPNMVLSNGIGQTFAFLLAKEKDKMGTVFTIMKTWLQKQMPENFGQSNKNSGDIEFLQWFNKIDQSDYLRAQHECLKLLEWLKRYARALCTD